MSKIVFATLVIGFLLVFTSVYADRGMISVRPDVSVYEPGQKAIIAWNGEEEVLLLSTDVASSNETLVIEILPLPSKPIDVKSASFDSFEHVQELILRRGLEIYGKALRAAESVEIVFHEKIGAHDITIVRADSASELADWIQNFLGRYSDHSGFCGISTYGSCKSDLDCLRGGCSREVCQSKYESPVATVCVWKECYNAERYHASCRCVDGRCQWVVKPQISLGNLKPIIEDYMERGFHYYVLDIVSTGPEHKSVEPVLYRFNTKFLYYPLEITSGIKGETKVTLFLLTENEIQGEYPPLKMGGYQTPEGWRPIKLQLSHDELCEINPISCELFDEGAWLTVLTYEGPATALTSDLMITEGITSWSEILESIKDLLIATVVVIELEVIIGLIAAYVLMKKKIQKMT